MRDRGAPRTPVYVEFTHAPKQLTTDDVIAAPIELKFDADGPSEEEAKPPVATDILEGLARRLAVTEMMPPSDEATLSAFLSGVREWVPDDYVALLTETNGFRVGDWRVLGTRARSIVLPDETFIVAAETEDSQHALCFRRRDASRRVILYDEIDDTSTVIGDSFVNALVSVTGENRR